jgi:hypothetical protein
MRCYICDYSPDAPSVLREGETMSVNSLRFIGNENRWICSKCDMQVPPSESAYDDTMFITPTFDEEKS